MRGKGWIDRQFGRMADAILLSRFIDAARAVDFYFFMAVRAFEVAHVFDEAQDGDVHQFRHLQCLFDDEGNQFLRGSDDEDAIDGQALEYGKGNIARSRRHIDEHVVDVAPEHVGPELFDCSGNDRSSPDDGRGRIFQKDVHGHDFNAAFGDDRIDAGFAACSTIGDAEYFRNGRAGNIGIEDCRFKATAVHLYGHERRDQGFTDAAFAADDGDDVFDMGAFMRLCQKALWFRTAFTVAGAAGTVVITVFTHCVSFSFCGIVSRFSRTARQNGLQHEPARSQTWILPPWMSRRLPYTSAKATL